MPERRKVAHGRVLLAEPTRESLSILRPPQRAGTGEGTVEGRAQPDESTEGESPAVSPDQNRGGDPVIRPKYLKRITGAG